MGRIGNLDQSLLNYFFGKRVTRLEDRWNCPPYQADCLDAGHTRAFHGPSLGCPQRLGRGSARQPFEAMRRVWLGYLSEAERAQAEAWG